MMKSKFTFGLLFWIVIYLIYTSWEPTAPPGEALMMDEADPVAEQVTKVSTIKAKDFPGNNYITGTLSAENLQSLSDAGIRIIIRLNGDSQDDRGFLSLAEEAAICRQLGMQFYYFNIEGKLEESGDMIHNLLTNGNAVIHCRHGAHRAPSMAAYHLQKEGYPKDWIIKKVGWEQLVHNPGRYERYTKILT